MKSYANMWILVATAFFSSALASGCSSRSEEAESRASNNNLVVETSSQTVAVRDMQAKQEAMLRAIKREAIWSKLRNLKEVSLRPGDSETRVWVGFALMNTPCFILKEVNGQKSAVFISAKVSRRESSDRKPRVLPVHTVLSAPQSGWLEFDKYLKEQGVEYPLRLSLDDKHTGDPDEETLVIEIKSGSMYSMIFFPVFTETADGKRALEVCRKIEQEFQIKLGCGNGRDQSTLQGSIGDSVRR